MFQYKRSIREDVRYSLKCIAKGRPLALEEEHLPQHQITLSENALGLPP